VTAISYSLTPGASTKLSSLELVPCASVMETDERASSALGSRMEGVSGDGLYMTNDDIICFIPGTHNLWERLSWASHR
jgi:hypothetical protein